MQQTEQFVRLAADSASRVLPKALKELVRGLTSPRSTASALVLHGMPLDKEIPLAPTDGSKQLQKSSYIAEAGLVGIGQLRGELFGYANESGYSNPYLHEGFPIAPAWWQEGVAKTALSDPGDLLCHQDMSYMADHYFPDLLLLLALREGPDTSVRTCHLDNRDILQRLPAGVEAILRDASAFRVKPLEGNPTPVGLKAIVYGPPNAPSIALRVDGSMEPQTEVAREAYQHLIDAVEAALAVGSSDAGLCPGVHLATGDLLVLANKKAVHGRSPVNHNLDGLDRLLLRGYFHVHPWDFHQRCRVLEKV